MSAYCFDCEADRPDDHVHTSRKPGDPYDHRYGRNRAWYGPKAEAELPPGWSALVNSPDDVHKLRKERNQ